MKKKLIEWYNRNISAGFYKASSWLINVVGVLIAGGPDAINWIISNFDMVTAAIPSLSIDHKAQLLLATNILGFVFRMWQQKGVQRAQIEQQAKNGQVVPLAASGVVVQLHPDDLLQAQARVREVVGRV